MAEDRTAEEREAARREREARRRGVTSDGAVRQQPSPAPARVAPRPTVPRPPSPRRPAARPGVPHSRRNRVVALIALLVAAVVVWFCIEVFQPFHGSGHGSVTVVIPAHSSVGVVGDRLAKAGVISSSFFFQVRATLGGDRGGLRPGTYHLKLDMSYGAALKILTAVPPPVPTSEVTIIPGRTRRQLDAILRRQGVKGSYFADTRSSPLLRPVSYGAPAGTSSLEGFLFPDTYQLRKPISIPALVADQLTDFKQKFAGVNLSYARGQHLTAYDVLIVASMVEAEAQTSGDRALVASVIYNRLRYGMPLQIDATTRYAVNNYTSPLTVSQLGSSSPFNTRIHKGLPPTPIANPGLLAIQAAAHPAQTNYLYFVVKPCGNGALQFASSYSQFLRYQQQYQTARARRGGNSPTSC